MIKGYSRTGDVTEISSFKDIILTNEKNVKIILEPYGFPKGLSYEFVLHLHNAKYMIFYFTNEGWNLCVKTDIFRSMLRLIG